ncbi:integumentary mucin A.1-like, partial [Penaeus monodon]|uniref:integumentary mucin A.1-like n=1 Tax=Penaeus monodon TaxID=6687 RepID=UPI0018A714EC
MLIYSEAPGEYKRPARWPQVSVDWASVGSFYTVLPPASEAESADTTAMARHAGESALVALLVLAAAMALPGQAYHLLSSDGSDSSVIEPRHLQRALACGGITASPGSETVLGPGQTVCVASPRYPNNYPKNWDNNWTIKGATPNVRLEISCSPVAIEGSPSCTNDRLVIMHKCFWSKYCGKKRPETITTCGPWARLTFRTNGSAQQKGFYCTVTASELTTTTGSTTTSATPTTATTTTPTTTPTTTSTTTPTTTTTPATTTTTTTTTLTTTTTTPTTTTTTPTTTTTTPTTTTTTTTTPTTTTTTTTPTTTITTTPTTTTTTPTTTTTTTSTTTTTTTTPTT